MAMPAESMSRMIIASDACPVTDPWRVGE